MKKIFIFCVMAITMCSCNNTTPTEPITPTIKQIKMKIYGGENLMEEIIPTTQRRLYVYEYDTKERLVFLQDYETDDKGDELCFESKIEYDVDSLKSISHKDKYDDEEEIIYKEGNCWYMYSDIDDIGKIKYTPSYINEYNLVTLEDILYHFAWWCGNWDGKSDSSYMFLPIRSDGTFAITNRSSEKMVVGKVVETDAYGNWTKVICAHITGRHNYDKEYSVIMREITYHE